ncbi:hypothetical protein [Psychrosphaera algicola]|uniref:Methyl-accepting chemotaxis protein n=1 Tax=Psychrosphaera algicola TaxID=3023714 RepID=A0ABT5FDS2_9GAMM|nr:hypothetical protein [Psychrosphaera sp. G1-22]MDC2888726.1 hypothetical protein [Psychrosphaera sp. G1-22]
MANRSIKFKVLTIALFPLALTALAITLLATSQSEQISLQSQDQLRTSLTAEKKSNSTHLSNLLSPQLLPLKLTTRKNNLT